MKNDFSFFHTPFFMYDEFMYEEKESSFGMKGEKQTDRRAFSRY